MKLTGKHLLFSVSKRRDEVTERDVKGKMKCFYDLTTPTTSKEVEENVYRTGFGEEFEESISEYWAHCNGCQLWWHSICSCYEGSIAHS
jgi:hypothetical protein